MTTFRVFERALPLAATFTLGVPIGSQILGWAFDASLGGLVGYAFGDKDAPSGVQSFEAHKADADMVNRGDGPDPLYYASGNQRLQQVPPTHGVTLQVGPNIDRWFLFQVLPDS